MKTLIATATIDTQVGIYDNCTAAIRVHVDRTLIRLPIVKWRGNTGGYAERNYRITGPAHQRMLDAVAKAKADDVDADDYLVGVFYELSEECVFV